MTNGTTVFDNRTTELSNNSTGSFLTTGGTYRTKTWAGADRVERLDRPILVKRVYTTLDRKGRVVKKTFKQRSPKRAVADLPHAYHMSAVAYSSTRHTTTTKSSLYPDLVTGNYIYDVGQLKPPVPSWSANDDLKIISQLKEKVNGSDFNLGVFLGEGHETLRMIGDSAIKLAKAGAHLRRGNVFEALRTMAKTSQEATQFAKRVPKRYLSDEFRSSSVTALSRAHLEIAFGWKPLLKDIQSGAEMLAHQLNVPFRQRHVVRRSVKLQGLDSFVDPNSITVGGEVYAVYSKQIIAYLSEKPTFAKLLGLADPELVAWELLPFSFLFDYVLPIGDWLDARAFASSLEGTFVTTVRTKQVWHGLDARAGITPSGVVWSVDPGNGDYRYDEITLDRSISNSLSVPLPRVKPLEKVASWQHCTNAIALMGVLLGGRDRKTVNANFVSTTLGTKYPPHYWFG